MIQYTKRKPDAGGLKMKRIVLMILGAAMIAGIFSGCSAAAVPEQEETTIATSIPTEAPEETEPAETGIPVAVSNDFRIALIAEDRIDQHWLDLEKGAMEAAEELGCEVVNLSPVMQDDVLLAEQIAEAVSEGFEAIVMADSNSGEVTSALQEAVKAGVKIIRVDTAAKVKNSAVLAADDRTMGIAAAEKMVAELEAREISEGAVAIIGVAPDLDPFTECEAGFREVFENKPYAVLETQYSEGDAAKAYDLSRTVLEEDPVGIFCCAEGCSVGAANAVKDSKKQTVIVGFGNSDVILKLIDDGYITASMIRNFNAMGYEGIKAACAVLNGEDLSNTVIDTGITVLTK